MKYLLTLYGEEKGWENSPPEEMKAIMDAWAEFEGEAGDAGVLLASHALHPSASATTMRVEPGAERPTTDGPFAETKEQLGGFVMVDVADLDEALAWARKVPVGEGWSIEARPVMEFDPAEGGPDAEGATAAAG